MDASPRGPDGVDELLAQLRRGDRAAVDALVRQYTPYLRAVIRRQIAPRLRARFDSVDVVQSVWVQVVQKLDRDGWSVESEAQLRALLATVARRRLVTNVRRQDAGSDAERPEPEQWEKVAQARYDRPSEVAQAADLWDALLEACPPEHHDILKLRREGLSTTEIAERTGLHDGSVRRVLRRVARDLALRQQPAPPGLPDAERE